MADFDPCFEKVIKIEGGYKLTNISGDRGGMTYAGISRVKNPQWLGWAKIDSNWFDSELMEMVKAFYREEFWDKIQGDNIKFQSIAYNLYEYGVNTGIRTAIKMCQRILKVDADGVFGDETLNTLHSFVADKKDEKIFVLTLSLMKIFRYKTIVMNDQRRDHDLLVSDQKFLCGWINRVESGLEWYGVKYP